MAATAPPTSPRFMLTTMASVAELEAGSISERTKAGTKAAKARGVRLGRHGSEVLGPKFKEKARQRAMELEPVITQLKGKGLSVNRSLAKATRWLTSICLLVREAVPSRRPTAMR